MQQFTSIPFKTESAHGITSYNGVAKFSSAGIVLEFESKLFGLIPGGIKEVRVPLGELLDVKFKKGVFRYGAKIEIRTKSFAALAALPNNNGRVTLKLVRDDFELGQSAVARIQKDMAEHIAQLPPTHTSVSVLFDESEDDTKELE
jgi:hypothetical protein